MSEHSNIRIIGGKWRSRKVSFKTKDMLRPTPDRVRETLFNWLAPYIGEAVCLDLFAGSGVLGLEALSRGAKQVLAIEKDRENVAQIEANKEVLDAQGLIVINKSVLDWLHGAPIVADLVFVDPPYKLQLLPETFNLLEQHGWVNAGGFIYFELEQPFEESLLPTSWSIWRKSKAGNVFFYLARKE